MSDFEDVLPKNFEELDAQINATFVEPDIETQNPPETEQAKTGGAETKREYPEPEYIEPDKDFENKCAMGIFAYVNPALVRNEFRELKPDEIIEISSRIALAKSHIKTPNFMPEMSPAKTAFASVGSGLLFIGAALLFDKYMNGNMRDVTPEKTEEPPAAEQEGRPLYGD